MAITEEQLHAAQETLADELPDADSVRVDVNEPNLAKFVVLVGEQQRYRLAVTHSFGLFQRILLIWDTWD